MSGVRREALRRIPDPVGRNWRKVPGSLAYLDAKARGEKSMPRKRRSPGGVQGVAPQDPRDMAKAGLPEAQSPAVKVTHPSERRPKPMPEPCLGMNRETRQPPWCGAPPSEGG